MEIIENICKIMTKKGITAYQVEQNTGISQTTFHNWRKGSQPSADRLLKILKYLEVTPNEIFGYENIELTENERELIDLFRILPEREQIKFIGRTEEYIEKYKGN